MGKSNKNTTILAEKIILAIKASNKIYELSIYQKVISDPIYS